MNAMVLERRRGGRGLTIPLLALGLLAVGCERGPSVPLPSWTLEIDGQPPVAVTLPVHLDDRLPARDARYVLRTQLVTPGELADRPLTFALASLPALASLEVDGAPATALAPELSARYRTSGALAFRLPPAPVGARRELALIVEHRWTQSGWIDATPTVSATSAGDGRFVAVTRFNALSHQGALVVLVLLALSNALLFVLDRRRRAHGFLAAQLMCGAIYPAYFLGLLQPVLGSGDSIAVGLAVPLSGLMALHMTHHYFGLGPVRRGWTIGFALVAIVAVALGGPFTANRWIAPITGAYTFAATAEILIHLVRLGRRPDRPHNVGVFLAASLALGGLSALDFIAWLGVWLPSLSAGWLAGVRLGSLGLAIYSLGLSAAMARDLVVSLRRSDELAAERAERMATLEAQNLEIRGLYDELRRQVAERSRDLSEALGKLDISKPRLLHPGDDLDSRYRVIRSLGTGGMARVYEVERKSDQKLLALKVLEARQSGTDLARFAREAEIATQVAHPNLVAVLDVGVSHSGVLYLVMELVAGGSLEEQRERFGDVDWALPILGQVASGIAAIHAVGVVHRDLKPSNVLLAGSGGAPTAKITDFGISSLRQIDAHLETLSLNSADGFEPTFPDPAARAARSGGQLTEAGAVLGTPLYMAPEQVSGGHAVRPAVDIYSFGIMAYELVTGRYPFRSAPAVDRLRGRPTAVPPLVAAAPLDPAIGALLTRCLLPTPTERPSAGELAAALTGGTPPPTERDTPRLRPVTA
jgi:hypothetical protein